MTVSYLVRYEIVPENAIGFLEYYRTRHTAILWRMPGLQRLVLHRPADCNDPAAVTAGTTFLLVQMDFADEAALKGALASPARAEARADFHRFPAFAGTVTHQAMTAEEVPPPAR
ncbi:MAG: EthD family reductase [Rhodospirillales bacterium]